MAQRPDDDRYEPLPSLFRLPGHLLRQLSPRMRRVVLASAALLVVGAVVAGALLIPGMRSDEAAEEERQAAEDQTRREQRVRELRSEQRVMRASGRAEGDASAPARLHNRRVLLGDVRGSILDDAEARVRSGEFEHVIVGVDCFPYPRTADDYRPERDLAAPEGRYECVAATSEIPETESSPGGVIGQPFRARVNFESGRYAWCKISGVAGEGAFSRARVGVPRACGGNGAPG